MKFLILLILLFPGSAFAAGPEELAVRGDYAGAAALYLQQARAADQKGNHAMAVPAQLNAATCMKMSGDVSAAALHLETARKWASPDATPGSRLELLALEGSTQVLSKRPANAVTTLQEALALAGTHGDLSLRIDILNDLGIALSACGKHDESITNFSKALALSDSDGEKHFRARQNQLVAEFQA